MNGWMDVLGPDLIKETPIQVTWSPFAAKLAASIPEGLATISNTSSVITGATTVHYSFYTLEIHTQG